ncbi:MAG: radical SAM protein [Rhodospirillaceae bacterium]|jgi:MoaA/NifB/PqqE/SkfB family radical SAM enzyme|nr:radical SAM protein [Rhodospirillaceae bacterium]
MTFYSPWRHLPSIFRKGRPIQLTFFVTRDCNAKCPWCFYLRSADGMDAGGVELSLDEIRKISRSLGRLLWVAFSGGEVFLRDDLVEISGAFHDQNRPSVLLFPTNGLLPERVHDQTEEILKRCPNSVIVVKVSIDGVGASHDVLRGSPGGFEKAMETHRLLGELAGDYVNLELGINTVFCSDNQDRMAEIIDFVGGLETAGTHTISAVRGNLIEQRYKNIDIEKYRHAADRLETNLRSGATGVHRFTGSRLKAAQDILQRRLIHRTLSEDRRLVPCYSGRLSLVLSESGEVYPCEILKSSFGNLRDFGHDMRKLLRSERARAAIRPITEGACHCTHECNFINNILFNPRLYPALIKEWFKLNGLRPAPQAPPPSPETASCRPSTRANSAGP